MLYLIEVILYTATMLLVYALFLRNKPVYQLSRYYMLACTVLPLMLPLLRLPSAAQERMQSITTFQFTLPEIIIGGDPVKYFGNHPTNLPLIFIPYLRYCLIAAIVLTFFLWKLIRIRQIIRKGKSEHVGSYVLIRDSGYGPGSFGKYILFPGREVNETILKHEQAHIQLHHTRDIIFLNLLQAILWPNLFLIWIKKEIKQVHEFQADAHVNANKQEYAQLILSSIFNTPCLPEMHSFIIHPIKRRIMMLQKNGKASPVKAVAQVAASLLLFFTVAAVIQSCEKKDATKGQSKYSVKPFSMQNSKMDRIDTEKSPDVYPQFLGGSDSMIAFISREMKYPEYARVHQIEGKVVVKFIVMNDGAVLPVTIAKSPDSSLSRAALDLIGKMPKWEPGRMKDGKKVNVVFYLPLVFKLQ